MKHIVIFASGSGTNAQNIIEYFKKTDVAKVTLVLSNKKNAKVLERAKKLNVPEESLTDIRRGALLHDIGKMGIPDSILFKPGPLTPKEWEVVRQHPKNALQILSPIRYLKPALDIPLYHHEKWDWLHC